LTIAGGLSVLVPEKLQNLYAEKEKALKRYWASQELNGGKSDTKGEKKR
jgi:hypothetical protein